MQPILKYYPENIICDDKSGVSGFAGNRTSNGNNGFQASISKT
jgi:hypothetical protein